MEKLPRGITGFYHITEKSLPEIDIKNIEKTIENLNNSGEFWNVKLTEQKVDNNFYLISFSSLSGSYKIGFNSVYPLFCGIESLSNENGEVEFCNLPKQIIKHIPQSLKELRAEYLNKELNSSYLSKLSKHELKEIEYWETKKIGNVIFNKYD